MGTTSNEEKNLFRRGGIIQLPAHDSAPRQCWRNTSGKERDAWQQDMPAGMLIRKNG
jgi:hypothetical protein